MALLGSMALQGSVALQIYGSTQIYGSSGIHSPADLWPYWDLQAGGCAGGRAGEIQRSLTAIFVAEACTCYGKREHEQCWKPEPVETTSRIDTQRRGMDLANVLVLGRKTNGLWLRLGRKTSKPRRMTDVAPLRHAQSSVPPRPAPVRSPRPFSARLLDGGQDASGPDQFKRQSRATFRQTN